MRSPVSKLLKNQKGQALIETIPLLVIFVVLIGFGLGLYGVVQTSILHSIAARTYSWETFRQRTNLYYFREDTTGLTNPQQYYSKGWRYHAITHENDERLLFVATTRPISFPKPTDLVDNSQQVHDVQIYSLPQRNDRISVNPAWVMVGYGLCLNAGCGGN